ncbi:hypothetical protein HY417_02875 [Candidatus Kaiserbacteria bacterium]|nr:hypothetical protein [Candidatus Kaiserbacteria bacterium]
MLYGLSNKFRAGLAALGLIGAIALPPWVPLLAMTLLSLRFSAWEAVVIGALVDFLWFTPNGVEGLMNGFPLFTLVGLALAWGLEPLRSELLT